MDRDWPSEVRANADRQQPFAFVLGCIDSRVPVEVIFDRGVGDLFIARVAGNVLNDDLLGSMEFACSMMGASLVLVLGHTACGAVEGAIGEVELGHLTGLVRKIQASVEAEGSESARDADGFSDRVAERNVRAVVASVRDRSPVLAELERSGKVVLAGAMYDVGTGEVRFL